VVRVLSGAFYLLGVVPTEISAAFRAYQSGDSLRFNRWKSIDNNIFNPIGMVTRTAAVFVPIARP